MSKTPSKCNRYEGNSESRLHLKNVDQEHFIETSTIVQCSTHIPQYFSVLSPNHLKHFSEHCTNLSVC